MRVLLIILFLVLVYSCPAQQPVLQYDSSAVGVRHFNAGKMKAYADDRDFQYDRYREPPRSIWQRFWSWVWHKIDQMLSTEGGATTFKTVMILVAVLVLGFFIYQLTGMKKAGLFQRGSGAVAAYSVTDEDIHAIPFDQAIEQAVASGDYRLAVRLLYLQSLKKLSDRNLVNWQLNKTNITYLQELHGHPIQPAFSNLTLQFENNWYGDIPIHADEFSAVREQFNHFNRQIS